VPARELQELDRAGMHDALLRASDDRHAAAAAELEQSFIAKLAQCPQHRVAIHAENCREVANGRQAIARLRFPLGDCPPDLGGNLLVEVGSSRSIYLDVKHLCYA